MAGKAPFIIALLGDAKILRSIWNAASQKSKTAINYNFARYFDYFLRYIVKNKLSGQVLGKYRGLTSSNTTRSRMKAAAGIAYKPGRYKDTILNKSMIYNNRLEAFVYATVYGKAWEEGFRRKAYTITAKHSTADGRPGYLQWWNGMTWVYRRSVKIKAQTFAEKPHIRPSIIETRPQFMSMVFRPLLNLFLGRDPRRVA